MTLGELRRRLNVATGAFNPDHDYELSSQDVIDLRALIDYELNEAFLQADDTRTRAMRRKRAERAAGAR